MQSPESVSVPLPSAAAASPSEAPAADWSLAQRIGFRFACGYFLLYFLPTPLYMLKIDIAKLLLINRGFHWINEAPFNR